MEAFDQRKRAYENKFARDHETNFMVNMKACSLLARDIAENKLKLDERATDRYCETVLSFTVKDCNLSTLYQFISKRLKKHGIDISLNELDALYERALGRARAEILLTEQ